MEKPRPAARPRVARNDMGVHPAYGHRAPNGSPPARGQGEEDYGGRDLHRQAGTAKEESLHASGIDPESRETARETDKPAARKGLPVARGQSVKEREADRRGAKPRR